MGYSTRLRYPIYQCEQAFPSNKTEQTQTLDEVITLAWQLINTVQSLSIYSKDYLILSIHTYLFHPLELRKGKGYSLCVRQHAGGVCLLLST